MKKLFSSFVAAGTVASFAFCGKKDKAKSTTTKNTKTENKEGGKGTSSPTSKTVVRGKKAKGKFKIGYVASNPDYAWNLRNTIKLYTQDVTTKSDTGKEYFELPSGLFLESSTKYNSIVHEYEAEDYTISLKLLKAFLLRKAILLDSDEEDGSTHTKYTDSAIDPYSNSKPWSKREYTSYDMTALNALFINNHKNPNEQPLPAYVLPAHYYSRTMMTDKGLQLQHIQHKDDAIFGITGGTRDTIATIEEFENMFTMEVVLKIYNTLKNKTEPTALDLQKAFKAAGLKVASVDFDDITSNSDNIDDLKTVYFNAGRRSDAKIPIKKIMTDKQTKIIDKSNKDFFINLRVLPAKLQDQINWLESMSKLGIRFVSIKGSAMKPAWSKTKETKEITKLITLLNANKKAAGLWLKKMQSIENSKTTTTPLYKDITKINKEFLSSNMAPKKMLSDKTKLASKNLDALFIHVTDEKENSSDVYKSVVEKKEFKDTKLFFIGEKAKAQSGASSKTFAGGNVSTASFNKYAAAYVAGFQAAVGAIKYSSSEDEYEETNVVFLIGSTSESEDKKKAFAFRRGVEAAAAHPAYSKYLKVKFVSKTQDSSKSSKKLYREISEWKAIDDSKTKLYEFSSSDTFTDGDRRIVYIAGATARDWAGETTNFGAKKWDKDDDTGLIGALYNYKKITSDDTLDSTSLASKTFGGSGVWILLDDNNESPNSPLADSSSGRVDEFERREIQFMGFIGGEASGTTNYVKFAIRGHFMGQANYMVGKHTIFGAPITPYQAKFKPTDSGVESSIARKEPWQFQKTGKDTVGKNYDRFRKSLAYAWSVEITEAEITKSSPWLK